MVVSLVWIALLLAAAIGVGRLQKGRMLAVQSASMQPLFKRGDLLWLQPPTQHFMPGQVVSYASRIDGRQVVSHRIIAFDQTTKTLITKGDNLPKPDPPIRSWDVFGVVRYIVPYGGYVLNALFSWIGLICCIYLPAVVVLAYEARRLCTDKKVTLYCVPHYIH